MNKIKFETTECFKKGMKVWFSWISISNGGNLTCNTRPQLKEIREVAPNYISLSEIYGGAPETYFLISTPAIEKHIALTKEEAMENYNENIKEEIEKFYRRFKTVETRLRSFIL